MKNKQDLLTQSELLSRSWQELKKRFAPFMLLACGAPLVNWLFNSLLSAQQIPVLAGIVLPVEILANTLFTSALVLFICKRADSPKQAIKMALPILWRLILAFLILTAFLLIVVLGAVFVWLMLNYLSATGNNASDLLRLCALFIMAVLFVASIVLGVYLCMLPYPLILTNEGIFSSFRTAVRLVKGFFWNTLGLLLILALIVFLIGGAASLVLSLLSLLLGFGWILSLLLVPVIALLMLVTQIPMVALYLDRSSTQQNEADAAVPSLEEGKQ